MRASPRVGATLRPFTQLISTGDADDTTQQTFWVLKNGHTYGYIYGHFADLATVINWNLVLDHVSPPPNWQPTGGIAFNLTTRAMLLDKFFVF